MDSERFSGLSNQGATCYMNSLLQTLFMTPDFLFRLYQWKWDESRHSSKELCIPYQLQLLFCKLHLRQSSIIETTGLTRSFQWDLRECLQQHDVQEFCRELFAAIEESVKGTAQEKMITELYEGTYVDYVKCLKCGTESVREDKFLDLSLAVKGHNSYNDSLEKALREYVKPDVLTGDNKYHCENCAEKTDAKKGMKLKKIPYVLALQLKRFDLDYSTMQRKKINDRVSFPLEIDLFEVLYAKEGEKVDEERLMQGEQGLEGEGGLDGKNGFAGERGMSEVVTQGKVDLKEDENFIRSDRDLRGGIGGFKGSSGDVDLEGAAERRGVGCGNGENDGNMVYELFSIMVHSGSALGGHYLAYIRSFETGNWYSFNDSVVKEIDEKELEKAYGGSVGNGIFGSNAYMFMYRKKSPSNLSSVLFTEIPSYLISDIQNEEEDKERAQKLLMERMQQITLNLYLNNSSISLSINKTLPLKVLKQLAIKEFKISYDLEDVRIRKYDAIIDQLLDNYEDKENCSIESLEIVAETCLFIETKQPDEDFPQYRAKGIHLKLAFLSNELKNCKFLLQNENFYRFTVGLHFRIRDLITLVANHFKLSFDRVRLWRLLNVFNCDDKLKDFKLLEITEPKNLNSRLLTMGVTDGFVLLLEDKAMNASWKEKVLNQDKFIVFHYNNPKTFESGLTWKEEKEAKVSEVKKRLSDFLGYESSSIKLRKGGENGPIMPTEDITLLESGIKNNSKLTLHLFQTPSSTIDLNVYLPGQPPSPCADSDWYFFSEPLLLSVPLSTSNLTQFIIDSIDCIYPTLSLSTSPFRIREKVDKRLINQVTSLSCLSHWKNPEIFIELEPKCNPDELILVFRLFDPVTWDLSPIKSINIQTDTSLDDLEAVLQAEFDLDEDLEITRITYLYNFTKSYLVKANWIKLKGTLNAAPLFVTSHGTCFV